MDRAKAMFIIHSTIRDEKYLFDFIKNSISNVTNEAKSDVLDEYQTIKCASFATLEAFLIRWQSLRKRVKDVGYKIDDIVELTNLFNAKNYTDIVAAKVEVKTKDTTKEVKIETNGDERIACDVCGKKIYKNLKYFLYIRPKYQGLPY
ncbi:hypothetical protein QBC32DRAFT_374576 [Pseudoneurospora amorphoporcata]|uniref:Uncharacterized protein n=1 Tax=Pseudoneurospora amorphoporcata TaxID=241081 RepID=A0AAN6SBP5_9PEZI|nr:hypothetical protein QBC32DRAFT_374576 [Pseudoneurospora amorphoporcata]